MHGIVEPILDVTIERRHEAVPQAAFGEDQEAQAVDLMHRLDDAGEEGLGGAVAVIGAARQQQIFELVEGDDDRDFEALENFHQHFEQPQHQVLPRGPHLEIQLREPIRQEVGEIALIAQQGRPRETLINMAAQLAGGVAGFGAVDGLGQRTRRRVRLRRCTRRAAV